MILLKLWEWLSRWYQGAVAEQSQPFTIGYLPPCVWLQRENGWYVSRRHPVYGAEYLHDDGVWRVATARCEDGEEYMGGWFATKEDAQEALRAWGEVTLARKAS